MKIDWFTFTAQILNFLLLVWLLKRFLFAPIVNAMDKRESDIAQKILDAQNAKETADTALSEYQAKLDELSKTREQLLADAGREVEVWRDDHLQEARHEVDHARTEWERSLAREKQSFVRQLHLECSHHAVDFSRHLLQQLADRQLQSQLVAQFLKQIKTADSVLHESDSGEQQNTQIQVESSHVLSENDRELIARSLSEHFGFEVSPEFRENPDLVCGIELKASGYHLAWSIRESLAELDSALIDSIDQTIPTEFCEAQTPADSTPANVDQITESAQ